MDFKVKGMTCSGCSNGVARTVGELEGVTSCEVNLATETAKVLFDAAITTPRRIVERIQQMGYEAQMMG